MELGAEKLRYVVSHESTIEEAWSIIEENDRRSVIVVEDNKVVGTVSDGDLRKAMLAKRLLSTPIAEIMNVNFVYLTVERKEQGRQLFAEKQYISLVPVVDNSMNLLDVLIR